MALADFDSGERVEKLSDDIASDAELASERFERVGRIGWAAKGVVYALLGVLFVGIALPGGSARSAEASQAGAIEAIATQPFGKLLLAALGAGLALYAIWRLFTVGLPGDWTGMALVERGAYLVSALAYVSLLVTITSLLLDADRTSTSSEDTRVKSIVTTVLDAPAGRPLVVIAGLAMIILGVVFAKKGWTRSFREEIRGHSGVEGTLIDRLGTAGWIARGVSMGVIGCFLIQAALRFDPSRAAGFDDSIRQLAEKPFGAVLAGMVGVGFVAYGVFATLSARHRVLEGPHND